MLRVTDINLFRFRPRLQAVLQQGGRPESVVVLVVVAVVVACCLWHELKYVT